MVAQDTPGLTCVRVVLGGAPLVAPKYTFILLVSAQPQKKSNGSRVGSLPKNGAMMDATRARQGQAEFMKEVVREYEDKVARGLSLLSSGNAFRAVQDLRALCEEMEVLLPEHADTAATGWPTVLGVVRNNGFRAAGTRPSPRPCKPKASKGPPSVP